MLASCRWICELSGVHASAQELADRLTFAGLEVEGVEPVGQLSDKIVLAKVVSKESHPSRDKLSVVEVDTGTGCVQVVCGAANCPGEGGLVVLAGVGARIGSFEISSRELAGVMSEGMLASEEELGIGSDGDGILVLNGETDAPLGTPITRALDLEDWILDVGITPNRPDALGHRGVAREAAMLFGLPFSPPKTAKPAPVAGNSIDSLASVAVEAPDLCPRYGAAVLTGVTSKPSPFKVRYRLYNLGLRSISNLVDVTNLILFEYGQPIHAFDLDKLAGATIVVRRAREKESMKTLDEIERVFGADDLLICDENGPVAVAGVMGGLDTGVTEETKRVLIECAYFSPGTVRRTSKRLKLSSDSSYRFERGVDPNLGPEVLEATVNQMVALAGGSRAPGLIDCYPAPIESRVIPFRPARYEALIGCEATPAELRRILEGIGAEVNGSGPSIEVRVPTSRPDIEREVDLVEEVLRVKGFEGLETRLPRIRCVAPNRPSFEAHRRAKQMLAALGLQEAITYSFVPGEMLALLGMDEKTVKIANPLSKERATMRTSLLPGLLESLKRATTRFLPGVRQFEVARTFHDVGAELPEEVLRAAAILSGPAPRWVGEEARPLDFFDAKGILVKFLTEYAGRPPGIAPANDIACFHPKRACRVHMDGERIGVLGEIHPDILGKLKLPRGAQVFEVAIEALWRNRKVCEARAVPEFPSMVRDVALLVDERQDSAPIGEALLHACGALAVHVGIFDVYSGKGIPEGKKSLAFSVTYRAADRTLTDDEVDGIHKNAVKIVEERFAASQR